MHLNYGSWLQNDDYKIPYTTLKRYKTNILNNLNQNRPIKSKKQLFVNTEANLENADINLKFQDEPVTQNIIQSVEKSSQIEIFNRKKYFFFKNVSFLSFKL